MSPASERAFSQCKLILTRTRNRILEENAKLLSYLAITAPADVLENDLCEYLRHPDSSVENVPSPEEQED